MAETVPKGSLFKPNWENAELYIFRSSLKTVEQGILVLIYFCVFPQSPCLLFLIRCF